MKDRYVDSYQSYQEELREAREREGMLSTAARAISANARGYKIEITDNKTGAILFTYENGAVQWIDGNFARELLEWTAKNCD